MDTVIARPWKVSMTIGADQRAGSSFSGQVSPKKVPIGDDVRALRVPVARLP